LAGTEAGDYLHHLNNDKMKHHSQDFSGTRLFSSQTLENRVSEMGKKINGDGPMDQPWATTVECGFMTRVHGHASNA